MSVAYSRDATFFFEQGKEEWLKRGGFFSPSGSSWVDCLWGDARGMPTQSVAARLGGRAFFQPPSQPGWEVPFLYRVRLSLFEWIDFLRTTSRSLPPEDPPKRLWNQGSWSPSPSFFQKAVRQFSAQSDLKKGVPWSFLYLPSSFLFSTALRLKALESGALSESFEKVFGGGFWSEQTGFLGATPELLIAHSEAQPRVFQSMALAGTWRTPPPPVWENTKEAREHAWVVQGVCEQAKRCGAQGIPGRTTIEPFTSLWHLVTPIEWRFDIPPPTWDELVASLHPTPALGGYPSQLARQWLWEYEKTASQPLPRGFWGGPFHIQIPGQRWSVVSIRNIHWGPGFTRLGAGCGITQESDCEEEWAELEGKVRTIWKGLGWEL